jgi:hypothetical protein
MMSPAVASRSGSRRGQEAFVDVVAAVGTDEEAAAVVEPAEGSFDDPAVAAEAGAVVGLGAMIGLTPRCQSRRRYLSWS